jgi:hypothetical protein
MDWFFFKRILIVAVVCFTTIISEVNAYTSTKSPFNERPTRETVLAKQEFSALMRVDPQAVQADINRHYGELNIFLAHLRKKQQRYRSEKRFLSYFFYKVHRKFLKQYRPHTTFHELLEEGSYDCVTGTALYALLLDALGISYQVSEFPFHVYLRVVTTRADTFLIESTDPLEGWVTNSAEQKRRFVLYSQVTEQESEEYFQYDFTIVETIDLSQLVGLSYFNEAVAKYNQRNIRQAVRLLSQAERWYASPRMSSFKSLISSVAQNN